MTFSGDISLFSSSTLSSPTHGAHYTLKTGTPAGDGYSILKLLRGVSHPEIQLGVGIYGNSISDDKQRPIMLMSSYEP